jgi:hypothetical protein
MKHLSHITIDRFQHPEHGYIWREFYHSNGGVYWMHVWRDPAKPYSLGAVEQLPADLQVELEKDWMKHTDFQTTYGAYLSPIAVSEKIQQMYKDAARFGVIDPRTIPTNRIRFKMGCHDPRWDIVTFGDEIPTHAEVESYFEQKCGGVSMWEYVPEGTPLDVATGATCEHDWQYDGNRKGEYCTKCGKTD